MKKNIYNYKTEILIFLISFILYFVIGTILTYYLQTYKFVNVLFDLDTPRVFGDLTSFSFNHYRASVHPLFVIFFQPIVFVIKNIINNPEIAVVLLQCFLSAINLVIVYLFCKKLQIKQKLSMTMTIIFGCMFNQIVFTASIETYIFAQFFLILMWYFALHKIDNNFTYWDYIILTIFGITSLAITITNFVQFLIVVMILVLFNKKISKRIITSILIVAVAFAFSVLFAEIQNLIWPSAPNFFTKNVNDFLSGTSEELIYTSINIKFNSIINVLNANFVNTFNLGELTWKFNTYLNFKVTTIGTIISAVLALLFTILNIFFMVKTKFNIKKDKLYYAMVFTILINFALHLFYGNYTAFIYTCHYNFLIIFMLVYMFNNLKFKLLNNNKFLYSVIVISILLAIKSVVNMLKILFPLYNPIKHFEYFPIAITAFIICLILFIFIKNKYIKIISIIVIILLIMPIYKLLNLPEKSDEKFQDVLEKYNASLDEYKAQLKEMKNIYSVRYFSDPDAPIGIFYFGMANRPKILYKDGKLIDIKTKKTIREFEYEEELIIPNEYTVLLKDKKENICKIYENEKGIYIDCNGNKEIFYESIDKINLPEFDDEPYSEILKVLHQEVLYNIDGNIPKPNLVGYKQAWYRDSMLAVMVLEQSNNTDLLLNWVNSLDDIYDYARSSEIKETDNLGELLYIIGATNADRKDLINKVLDEIDKIKQDDGTISGYIDAFDQKYYPTSLAIHGAKKLGIYLDLTLPNYDDGYAKLTWYNKNDSLIWGEFINSILYPYLGWAQLHYTGYGYVYMLNEIYPLSYEAGDPNSPNRAEPYCFISEYYCEKHTHISHLWDASEKFLFLIEQ